MHNGLMVVRPVQVVGTVSGRYRRDGRKPPRETGLTPLGRPDLRGCALWTRGAFGAPAPRSRRSPTNRGHVSMIPKPNVTCEIWLDVKRSGGL
eukprot:796478-Prymnesium_polylepis.1